jgi:hypothetical protein
MDELDIWRSAQLLINQHGADAELAAAARVDDMIAAGAPEESASIRYQVSFDQPTVNAQPFVGAGIPEREEFWLLLLQVFKKSECIIAIRFCLKALLANPLAKLCDDFGSCFTLRH